MESTQRPLNTFEACAADSVEVELLPTELNTSNHLHYVDVEKDKLTFHYTGPGQHTTDVGAVQANRPLPQKQLVYYFEITVLDIGSRGAIAIGLSEKGFQINRQPGWEQNSYGYLGEDGRKYGNGANGNNNGEDYGPRFSTGDVVGCGFHFGNQDIFFTKNGKYLEIAFHRVSGLFYPTIGLHSNGERVSVNFGKQPFRFDIDSFIQDEKEKKMRAVQHIPMHVADVNMIVKEYLLHYGYENTLKSFEQSCNIEPEEDCTKLTLRKEIRQLLLSGDVKSAIRVAKENFPCVVSSSPSVFFRLCCQQFIELIKKDDIDEALQFAQSELAGFRDALTGEEAKYLQDVVALLAYPNPHDSPIRELLDMHQREHVADVVNRAILGELQMAPRSALEGSLNQLTSVQWQLREEMGGAGVIFKLADVLS